MQERVAIYNRCSTEEEAQMNALSTQAAESREIAIQKGWFITDQYIESESGTTVSKRSEYQRLMDDMDHDKFDIVMIKSIDRLMRSTKDWYLFLDKLTRNKKRLYIYIDSKFYSPDDSLITGIKAMLAEEFSRDLSKKIKNAHHRRQNKKTGLNITRPMFGWDKVGKNLYVINEKEAESYRTAFAMAKEGKGFYTIAKYMYENGVRGKSGKRISDVQWRKMIYSSRAHGTVILHTDEYDFETKKRVKLAEREWIYVENALPPIVSYEYQKEVLEAILERAAGRGFTERIRKPAKAGLYALSGKLYCAECGNVYYRTKFTSKGENLIEWKCSQAINDGRRIKDKRKGCNNINVVESEVLHIIENACKNHYDIVFGKEELIVDEALAAIQKAVSNDNSEKELKQLVKELERQKQKKKVLFDKLTEEVISDSDFKMCKEELENKIWNLEDRIRNINQKYTEYNEYRERILKIANTLRHGNVVDQAKTKELIGRIDKILVHPDSKLEIMFNKVKLFSLLRLYNRELTEQSLDEKFFVIEVPYSYKNFIRKQREEITDRILEIFRENPNFMIKDVSAVVGMSISYVNTSIKQLKQENKLTYKRQGHTGKWIVTEE